MPNNERRCCFPLCSVASANNGFRGRQIFTKRRIRVTSFLYQLLKEFNNDYGFAHTDEDEVCMKCELKARNRASTKINNRRVFRKKRRASSREEQEEEDEEGDNNHAIQDEPIVLEADSASQEITNSVEIDAEVSALTAVSLASPSQVSVEVGRNSVSFSCISNNSGVFYSSDLSQHNSENQSNSEDSSAPSLASHRSQAVIASLYCRENILNGTVPFCLPGIAAIKYTERCCCICYKNGRSRIPYLAVIDVWIKKRIFVPSRNRCCVSHLENGTFSLQALGQIEATKSYAEATGQQISRWINSVTDQLLTSRRIVDFENSSNLSEAEFDMLLGVKKCQFEDMFQYIKQSFRDSKNRSSRSALAIFLMKLRLNISQRMIAFLFQLPHQSYVSKMISRVLQALSERFVPENVGFQHISRDDLMEGHMRPFYRDILGLPENSCVVIMDGTYLFVEKSTDHSTQRKTFCNYKKRNLLKPMMTVAPDGYIISADGLYFTDHGNNDSTIMLEMLKKPNSLLSILQRGDATILDRGFQGAIAECERLGLKAYMPSLLKKGQNQFTTNEANLSRRVTILRFIVELTNGRLKNKFRFLEDIIPAPYFSKLNNIFLVACAILNKFYPLQLRDTSFHQKVARIVEERMDKPNLLQQKIESERLDRKRTVWEAANQDCELQFPALSLEELKELTLGEYQLNMGTNYNDEHLSVLGEYSFSSHKEENGLLRIQLRSRYSSRISRTVWIQYEEYVNTPQAIQEWYCNCPGGARTVGCCSHVAAVLRYLSHDRFVQMPSKKNVGGAFLDAAANIVTLMADSDEHDLEESDSDLDLSDTGSEAESEELLDV